MQVQIVFASGHTSESYITEKGWRQARIWRCPICGKSIPRHGTYERKSPEGTKIARFYCRSCQTTVSLLPGFLAAGYADSLATIQKAVDVVRLRGTFDEAAVELRPDIDIQGARRWLRRRLHRVELTGLLAATGLGGEFDLASIREDHPEILRQLPTPYGLSHRPLAHWNPPAARQQSMGPDPPR